MFHVTKLLQFSEKGCKPKFICPATGVGLLAVERDAAATRQALRFDRARVVVEGDVLPGPAADDVADVIAILTKIERAYTQ